MRSRDPVENLQELSERGDFSLCRVDDGAPLLQRRRRPVFVLQSHPRVGAHVDDRRVHRFDVQPHTGSQSPAAEAARSASSTPSTTDAICPVSGAPPYAYSTFTPESATRDNGVVRVPGELGKDMTMTSRS